MTIFIRTYTTGQMITGPHFFILNKGMNSGRPDRSPCTNCFIVTGNSQEEIDRYYWLSYALWITGRFRYYLVGSVIPFIRIDEVRQLLESADAAVCDKRDLFMQAIETFNECHRHSQRLTARLHQLQQAKKALLAHFLHV